MGINLCCFQLYFVLIKAFVEIGGSRVVWSSFLNTWREVVEARQGMRRWQETRKLDFNEETKKTTTKAVRVFISVYGNVCAKGQEDGSLQQNCPTKSKSKCSQKRAKRKWAIVLRRNIHAMRCFSLWVGREVWVLATKIISQGKAGLHQSFPNSLPPTMLKNYDILYWALFTGWCRSKR